MFHIHQKLGREKDPIPSFWCCCCLFFLSFSWWEVHELLWLCVLCVCFVVCIALVFSIHILIPCAPPSWWNMALYGWDMDCGTSYYNDHKKKTANFPIWYDGEKPSRSGWQLYSCTLYSTPQAPCRTVQQNMIALLRRPYSHRQQINESLHSSFCRPFAILLIRLQSHYFPLLAAHTACWS